MSYDKLSLASFKEALKANKYVNATGARRAVGKATTLTDSDKEKARAAIDAHFGSTPATPAPKKVAAKKTAAAAPKKAAAKKAAAAAPKKTAAAAKPAAPKKAASKKAAAAAPRAPLAGQVVGEAAIAQAGFIDFENIGSIATQMKIAEKTIQNVGAALSVITQAKEKYPEAELGNVVEEMGGTLSGAVAIFQQVVNHIVKQPAATPAAKTAPQAQPQGVVNNGMPTRGESLFNESGPGATPAQTTA